MRTALFFAVTVLANAHGLAQQPNAVGEAAAASQSPVPPGAETQVESCDAHKFETTAQVIVDGKKRGSKVKLCGKVGQTDADWANTLRDAAKTVQANEKMPKTVRDQIVTALNGEIDKIEIAKSGAREPVSSALPSVVRPPAERPPEYSALPPIPTAPNAFAKSSVPARPRLLPKPRLSIQCMTPAELGGGSCESLRRNSVLTIRADENLVGGARLRFLRDGNFRDEITLAPMRKGQSLRLKLPPKVCAGVYRTRLNIEILAGSASGTGAAATAGTVGPYQLRC